MLMLIVDHHKTGVSKPSNKNGKQGPTTEVIVWCKRFLGGAKESTRLKRLFIATLGRILRVD